MKINPGADKAYMNLRLWHESMGWACSSPEITTVLLSVSSFASFHRCIFCIFIIYLRWLHLVWEMLQVQNLSFQERSGWALFQWHPSGTGVIKIPSLPDLPRASAEVAVLPACLPASNQANVSSFALHPSVHLMLLLNTVMLSKLCKVNTNSRVLMELMNKNV